MYAKIYRSLWEGSMRGHGLDQLVLVYLCAHADANGIADVIHDKIAADVGFPIQQVRAAVLRLESADAQSRSPEARGARLARLDEHRDWGWLVINYDKYRTASDIEKIKEQNRLRARLHRDRLRGERHGPSRDVTLRNVTSVTSRDCHAESRQAVSSKQKQKKREKKSVEESSILFPGSTVIETTTLVRPSAEGTGELTAAEAFDKIFWPEYPRPIAKSRARKAWNALHLSDDDDATLTAIMACLRDHREREWKDRTADKIPHPATWLNDRRWEDQK